MDESKNGDAYRIGTLVLVVLAILTLGEFAIGAIAIEWWQPLILIAIFKAVLIIQEYMHLPRLFAAEEGDHE